MGLSFQQKLVLENGSVVFYHKGTTESSEDYHVLIHVPGKNIEKYFKLIAKQQYFSLGDLKQYGNILHSDLGSLDESEIEKHIQKLLV